MVDLNLLPILHHLLQTRSVTRAADTLALSQPAVSKALGKLRRLFGDQLLVRDGRKMILTPRGEALQPVVDMQYRQMDMLWSDQPFAPATSERTFQIAATDYEAMIILPEMAPLLQSSCPGIALSFSDLFPDLIPDTFSRVDFVCGPRPFLESALTGQVRLETLVIETFVTVVHAAGGSALPLRHLGYAPGSPRQAAADAMPRLVYPDLLATLTSFTVLPLMCVLTDAAAIVPARIAHRFARFLPIEIRHQPDPPVTVEICLGWHSRWEDDAGHRWFRETLLETLRCSVAGDDAGPACGDPGSACFDLKQ